MSVRGSAFFNVMYKYFTPTIGGVSIPFNLLQLIAIFKFTKRGRMPLYMVYVASLSASDLGFGLFMVVLKSMDPFMDTTLKHNIVANEVYEILRNVLLRFSLFASIFNLLALTFDRFMAIKYPLTHMKFGKSFAVKTCVLIWILSFACVVAYYCITRFHLENISRYANITL